MLVYPLTILVSIIGALAARALLFVSVQVKEDALLIYKLVFLIPLLADTIFMVVRLISFFIYAL